MEYESDIEFAESILYTMYEWDCQNCGTCHRLEDDVRGYTQICEGCGDVVMIR